MPRGRAAKQPGAGVARRHDPAAPLASPRAAGLFHTAFLLPTRADLAQWLLHAAEQRVPLQGASDHLVSEAIYLADPEGNGIEVYWDRPSETWAWRDGMLVDGKVRTEPPRYAHAVRIASGERGPRGLKFSHNIFHPGTAGVSNIELPK